VTPTKTRTACRTINHPHPPAGTRPAQVLLTLTHAKTIVATLASVELDRVAHLPFHTKAFAATRRTVDQRRLRRAAAAVALSAYDASLDAYRFYTAVAQLLGRNA